MNACLRRLPALSVLIGISIAAAEDTDPLPPSRQEVVYADFKIPDGKTVPPFQKLDAGRIGIGKVIVDPAHKQIIIPALVNRKEGIIEYILSLPNGKLHEALLVTDADPLHMSVGLQLLGFKDFGEFFPPLQEEDPFFTPPTPQDYAHARVHLTLRWTRDGKQQKSDLTDLLVNAQSKEPLKTDQWVYTNSFFYRQAYQGSLCGNPIAIFADRAATINYAGDFNDGDNEHGWIVRTEHPLQIGDAVEVVISPETTQPVTPSRPSIPVLPSP